MSVPNLEIISPSFRDLKSTLRGARKVFVCTPFFSREGLEELEKSISAARSSVFWLALNPTHWVSGHSDFDALAETLRRLRDRQTEVEVRVRGNLHAKLFYAVDARRALLGSANLSGAGFGRNVEVGATIQGVACRKIDTWIDRHQRRMPTIIVDELLACIEVTRDEIIKASQSVEEYGASLSGDFNAAVDLFEKVLVPKLSPTRGAAKTRQAARGIEAGRTTLRPSLESLASLLPEGWPTFEQFLDYLRAKRGDENASELIERAGGKYNLQGHVKHFFWASLMFLLENPKVMAQIDTSVLTERAVRWYEVPWVREWKRFIDRHDDEFFPGIEVSFHTLKVYLPPVLGGTTTSGGAGVGNFKRTIAFLTEMLREDK